MGFIRDQIFLFSTDSLYPRVPGDQGGPIFSENFFRRSFHVQIGVLQFVLHVLFYVNKNATNLYVTNLY